MTNKCDKQEFCEPCAVCKHRADEHIAGDGHCFLCNCSQFKSVQFISFAEKRRIEHLKKISI